MSADAIFLLGAAIIGLVLGSFLNVVIHRLPKIMDAEWRAQCAEIEGRELPEQGRYNLLVPSSHCPHCQTPLRPYDNVPLLSYLLLLGRCRQCHAAISPRYPAVEALTAILSALVAWQFGWSVQGVLALALTWTLIALTFIDADTTLLPDSMTLPLLWLGLLANVFGVFAPLEEAVIGAAVGYLSLWSVYWLFKLATGREGMGYGDFKLLAALGAWLGYTMLLPIILLSSIVGAVVGGGLMLMARRGRDIPIPFGPYLAAAGFLTLLVGDRLLGLLFGP
jgi:leader peptidase (prepilin peptidase)/N-methyltransferase